MHHIIYTNNNKERNQHLLLYNKTSLEVFHFDQQNERARKKNNTININTTKA
jgi:hypothetical protein